MGMVPDSTLPPNMPPVIGENGKPIVAEPNRVTMRRLNQNEYDNTVRDLLGTATKPARVFLNDTQTHGFDNNGDLLGLTPTRLDQYFKAAEALADEALKAPLRAKVLTCDPAMGDSCLRTFVSTFGERAYRRPVTEDEITDYLTLAGKARTAGAMPEEVARTVLEAILLSPHFLFKVEIDADPTSLTPHPVAPFELASRLSYLVYGSMPDDALFAAAKAGQLADLTQLKAQLARMMADEKARFSQSFSEQWLDVRDIEASRPDVKLYPTFNAAVATAMKAEVEMFFDDFLKNNRPPEELLTARYSFLNDALAKHYGMAGGAATMARTDLTTDQRGGFLGMGALMTATSRGNRTSPVDRGRWVLASLLCDEPPDPPADLVVPTEDKFLSAPTARDFLAEHRKNPSCAACHNTLDPIGLALENYDAVGAWRTLDKGTPIDASGTLIDGTKISGPRDLALNVSKDPRFRACLTNYLLTYATGRAMQETDKPYIEHITKGTGGASVGLKDLLTAVVTSDPFRLRRGETVATGGQP